jgi:hypothetical protein
MATVQKNPGGRPGATAYAQHNTSTENITGELGKSNYQAALAFTAREAASVDYGIVTLKLHVEAGTLVRYTVGKEQSFLAGGIRNAAPVKA